MSVFCMAFLECFLLQESHPLFKQEGQSNCITCFNPFPNSRFQTSKLKEFADDNFRFDENG